MEIIPTFIQTPTSVEGAATMVFACCLALVASRGVIALASRLPALRVDLRTVLSAISLPGLAGSGALPDATPTFRGVAVPHMDLSITSPALYERVPPPRSLVRAGDIHRPVHPAIHGSSRFTNEPLFPRAERALQELEPWERGVIDLRRTSAVSKDKSSSRGLDHYTVLPGDTLWDIAAKVLRTDDKRAIARCWPKLHKANVDVIGRDPHLLRPGQVLYIPRIEDV